MAAMLLWYLGAALFLVFNVMEVIKGLIRRQVVLRAVIGCVLPLVIAYAFHGIDGDLANLSPCGPQGLRFDPVVNPIIGTAFGIS